MKPLPERTLHLDHLARAYPSSEAIAEEMINLQARLELPKETEHFISDIHGEFEAFCQVVSHASGSIKRRIGELFGDTLPEADR